MSRFELAARRAGKQMAAGVLVACACSGPVREAPGGDDAAVMPERLRVLALPGGNGVLQVTALTLRRGVANTELIAALENTGAVPACHAALSVELFDGADQSLAAGITGLLAQQFYRRTDGSGAIAACIAPGERTMAAITDLPAELEGVASVVYRCPYFALDVEPIAGLTVESLQGAAHGGGMVYTGTLVNTLEVSVDRPSVTVFPVNRVGRPLGVASASADVRIAPRGAWAFETNTVMASGPDSVAYPAGALGK